MTIKENTTPTSINFHFDPSCPLAWRTALWIREVRKVRPVDVTWRFFSLEVSNRKEGTETDYQNSGAWAGQRMLAMAQREGVNEAVEKLYLTLGTAQHGRKESIKQLDVIRDAAKRAGLDPAIVDAALADESTIQDVLAGHEEAVRRYRAFGVQTIAIKGLLLGFYGPLFHH